MRHSLYLTLATVLIKADLRREEKQWQQQVRRSAHNVPWTNAHILRDIGLDAEGRANKASLPATVKVERRVRHLRRIVLSRLAT